MDDFLGLEQQIVDHVKEAVTGLSGRFYSAADLSQIENIPKVPAGYVVFQGFNVLSQRVHSCAAKLSQRWMIVLVGRDVSSNDKKGLRRQIGPVITDAIHQLLGWGPVGYTELEIRDGPEPFYDENGFGYFPLVFETTMIVKKEE